MDRTDQPFFVSRCRAQSGSAVAPVAELAQAVLRLAPYLALRGISCEDQDGRVVLQGHLPSYYLKQVAQEVVGRLEGVVQIENRIQVLAPRPAVG